MLGVPTRSFCGITLSGYSTLQYTGVKILLLVVRSWSCSLVVGAVLDKKLQQAGVDHTSSIFLRYFVGKFKWFYIL